MSLFRYKNGQEIQPSGRYSFFQDQNGNYSLVISDALPQDSGSYEITVRNQYGTANSKTNLQILGEYFSSMSFLAFIRFYFM